VNFGGAQEVECEAIISIVKRQYFIGEVEEINCVLICCSNDGREEIRQTFIIGVAPHVKLFGIV
jgi:hypothetical protein